MVVPSAIVPVTPAVIATYSSASVSPRLESWIGSPAPYDDSVARAELVAVRGHLDGARQHHEHLVTVERVRLVVVKPCVDGKSPGAEAFRATAGRGQSDEPHPWQLELRRLGRTDDVHSSPSRI
ncbi:hypothetical protein F1D05_07925 [Kribbella qitaiheensis]|uniref:Uncharacterized protein n=1 Tax=Kribbella qitaiheensis TaxID=1544730 RepID=A0A7G6WV30_9ACTN|nr:hypothetical protein [Kribbella qitaiheensis]QNE17845.1 hypothetical protein F1D05_07925 [Kribbella qitaiheensis]